MVRIYRSLCIFNAIGDMEEKVSGCFFSEHSVDYLQIDRQSNVHECICGTDGQYNCHWCCQIVVDLYLHLKFPWRCHGLAEFFPKRWISAFDMEILSYYTCVIYDFDLLLIELLSIHCILRVKLTFLQPALTVRLLTVFKTSVQLWFHCSYCVWCEKHKIASLSVCTVFVYVGPDHPACGCR